MMRQYELVERVLAYDPDADEDLINKAYVYAMKAHAAQRRANGDPYFSHPLEVAAILTDLRLDDATVATALLHDVVEDTEATHTEIESMFGAEIGGLVDGLTKIKRLDLVTREAQQAEEFRRLLVAIARDVRVLLVKLADRLHNMRTLEHMKPSSRERISAETLEIYAPLAGRMGMHAMREELEEHAFRWFRPEAWRAVSDQLAALHQRNAGLVEQICSELRTLLSEIGLEAEVSGRAKRPYSIWRKMENKRISLEQLSDIYGFRLITRDIASCYRLLGAVHTRWSAVPQRFKDYISTPKSNEYRSIHTTVIGPSHQRVELQIRTVEMHWVAEYGIAAHALYKDLRSDPEDVSSANEPCHAARQPRDGRKGANESGPYVRLRRTVEQLLDGNTPEEFLEHTKLELFQDQVFCFTPHGRLIALPRGANAIDFAYAVHTDIGNTAVGAIVNGRNVPLTDVLSNGDEVEILTREGQTPQLAWENKVATGRARAAIRRAARDALRRQYTELGRKLLIQRLAQVDKSYSDAAMVAALPRLGHRSLDDALAAIGRNELSVDAALRILAPDVVFPERSFSYRPRNRYDHGQGQDGWFNLTRVMGLKFKDEQSAGTQPVGIPIRGVNENLPVTFDDGGAVPGDRIIGVLMPGDGIRIFQISSPKLKDHEHKRWIDVTWDVAPERPQRFPAQIRVTARNEPGALALIARVIAEHDGNIDNLKMTKRASDFTEMMIALEVWDLKHLLAIISELRHCAEVSEVERTFIKLDDVAP
ncbi:MAG: RelA/SpoT family protein [Hyphomicrobiaceae bacterium]